MVHGNLTPAQIGPFINDIDYPVNKKDIIQYVKNNNAGPEVIETLEELPNQKFNSSKELKRILGNIQREL